jgi:hypothetical protein
MAFDQIRASTGRKPRSLDHQPLTRRYAVRIAGDKELPELAALAERHIPGINNACETARLLHFHHRGSVLAAVRGERIVGGAAFLYLNSAGLGQLQSGIFPHGTPEVEVLTLPGEPPAAIYAWVLCLPAVTIGAIGNIMAWLQRPLYRQADIFAGPGTPGGMRFRQDVGFVETGTPGLWVYRRPPRSNFEYFSLEPFQ